MKKGKLHSAQFVSYGAITKGEKKPYNGSKGMPQFDKKKGEKPEQHL